MQWFMDLLLGSGAGHNLFVIAFVISLGLCLGRVKICGISFGATFVLLVGIAVSHFGTKYPQNLFTDANGIKHFVDPSILHFVKDYGLILFVYAIGLQVGGNFFSSFKKGGVKANIVALSIVLSGVALTLALGYLSGVSYPVMIGVMSGAITNTPGLGAAQSVYASVGFDDVALSNAYATAYPMGVIGTILVFIFLRFFFKVDLEKERKRFAAQESEKKESTTPEVKPRVSSLTVGGAFFGMLLGVVLGSIPIPAPGMAQPLKLGLAGGPLVVAILIGALNHKFHANTLLPPNSLLSMREIGIGLFLASVGLGAGSTFYETIVHGGLKLAALGSIITIVPILIIGLLSFRFLKIDYFTLIGLISGSYTNPPALAYSAELAGNSRPLIGYATVYPLTMFLRIVLAQVTVSLFL